MYVNDWHPRFLTGIKIYDFSEADIENLLSSEPQMESISIFNLFEISDPVFFRISTISEKDIRIKASSKTEIFETLITSQRILEDLELYPHQSLILKDWDPRIEQGQEYRCIIVNNKLEMTIRTDGTLHLLNSINDYVLENQEYFPAPDIVLDLCLYKEEIIFLEFNLLNSELDLFGTDWNLLSERGRILVNS